MLTNLHTHTTYCDGKSTPEEIVQSAISKGFESIGFSGHAYTPHDLISSMKDTNSYIDEINNLKGKYKDKIKIYLGIEEDASCLCDRTMFDYIIGSYHFLRDGEEYMPFDISYNSYLKCLERFGRDPIRMANAYYAPLCEYIIRRKPDIIGHFDLITKFDEKDTSIFLNNSEYISLARKYIKCAIKSGCIFEVNTGAMSRGYRTSPYPSGDLLYTLRREDARITITSDSHHADTLDFCFSETARMLKDTGFEYIYVLEGNGFVKKHI